MLSFGVPTETDLLATFAAYEPPMISDEGELSSLTGSCSSVWEYVPTKKQDQQNPCFSWWNFW